MSSNNWLEGLEFLWCSYYFINHLTYKIVAAVFNDINKSEFLWLVFNAEWKIVFFLTSKFNISKWKICLTTIWFWNYPLTCMRFGVLSWWKGDLFLSWQQRYVGLTAAVYCKNIYFRGKQIFVVFLKHHFVGTWFLWILGFCGHVDELH